MKALTDEVVQFFHHQGYTIISTIDKNGFPHNSCKGIVQISGNGVVYLFDLYMQETFDNLKCNPNISVTAVDEHKFKGYSLKGRAKIIPRKKLSPEIIRAWEERISGRITQRMIRNLREEKGHSGHPEALLPKPAYLIAVRVSEIVDLTPQQLK